MLYASSFLVFTVIMGHKDITKLTKIIATIGPSSDSPETIEKLLKLGVNVFRFNLKHNEISWHEERIQRVHDIAKKLDFPITVFIDLQGPEIRINVAGDGIELKKGDRVSIVRENPEGKSFTISHPDVIAHLKKGESIVIDDGRFYFTVDEASKDTCVLECLSDGLLKTRKTMNVPGSSFPLPVLTPKDVDAIKMARNVQIDYVALSFVRSKSDIVELKEVLKKLSIEARVISKIETKLAIDNIDEIIKASEGIMVARGDLGIELPMEQVPYYQKLIIQKCLERGIPVITSTQMLHSMTERPTPTRAEVSDIANAVYDATDTLMLSEETAAGAYPEKAVETMSKVAHFTEEKKMIVDTRLEFEFDILDTEEMMCDTAYNLYLQFLTQNIEVGGFVVFTQTGRTARKLSRYRPNVPIYVFAPDEKVKGNLSLSFAVVPFVQPKIYEKNRIIRVEDMQQAVSYLAEKNLLDRTKHHILLYGDSWRVEGGTSTVRVIPPQKD